jgi:hypothetical protein
LIPLSDDPRLARAYRRMGDAKISDGMR